MVRFSRRGTGMLIAAVVAFVAGQYLGYPILRILAGAMFAVVVFAVVSCLRRIGVSVQREIYPDRVPVGETTIAQLHVVNKTGRRSGEFVAREPWPGGYEEVVIPALAAEAQAERTYQLPAERRGRLPIGPLTLERTDILGLARARTTVGRQSILWVHPRQHPARVVVHGFPRHHHEGPITEPPMRGSLDVRAVREYVAGDEPRHVHWRATARTGRLMVRDFADPAEPRFEVLLDDRADAMDSARFEHAVEVAASLIRAAVTANARVRLRTTTGGIDLETTRGLSTSRRLLDRLSEVEQTAAGGTVVEGSQGGGSVVYISGGSAAVDHGVIARLNKRFRQVSVIDLDSVDDDAPGILRFTANTAAQAVEKWNAAMTGVVVR